MAKEAWLVRWPEGGLGPDELAELEYHYGSIITLLDGKEDINEWEQRKLAMAWRIQQFVDRERAKAAS